MSANMIVDMMVDMANFTAISYVDRLSKYIGLSITGDFQGMKEAAKTNSHLAKLLDEPLVKVDRNGRKEIRMYSGRDLRELKVEWNQAWKFELGRDGGPACANWQMVLNFEESEIEQLLTSLRGNGEEEEASAETSVKKNGEPSTENDYKEIARKSRSTAELLQEAIMADALPVDPLTRQQFGFSKCNDIDEEAQLLSLYGGLCVSTTTLQNWQKKNKIATGIHHAYTRLKKQSHAFEWFRRNRQIVDRNYARREGVRNLPKDVEARQVKKLETTISATAEREKGEKLVRDKFKAVKIEDDMFEADEALKYPLKDWKKGALQLFVDDGDARPRLPGEKDNALERLFASGLIPTTTFTKIDLINFDTRDCKHTADILRKAVDNDTIPQDLRTREHFGFSKVNTVNEESNLLGLYTGLFHHLEVRSDQVFRWQKANTIAKGLL